MSNGSPPPTKTPNPGSASYYSAAYAAAYERAYEEAIVAFTAKRERMAGVAAARKGIAKHTRNIKKKADLAKKPGTSAKKKQALKREISDHKGGIADIQARVRQALAPHKVVMKGDEMKKTREGFPVLKPEKQKESRPSAKVTPPDMKRLSRRELERGEEAYEYGWEHGWEDGVVDACARDLYNEKKLEQKKPKE